MPHTRLVVRLLLIGLFSFAGFSTSVAQISGKNDPPEQLMCKQGCNDWPQP